MSRQPSLGDQLDKTTKRTAGRTDTAQVPANIRFSGVELSSEAQASLRQALGRKLGKYASSIERVSVRLSDVNGPRGGVDKICRIKVVLSGLPSAIFESQAATLKDALNGALIGIEENVSRSVRRRQTKPLKATGGASRPAAAPADDEEMDIDEIDIDDEMDYDEEES